MPDFACLVRRRMPVRYLLVRYLLGLWCGLCWGAALAQSVPAARHFEIPALPLDSAVLIFAEQAGVEVFVDASLSDLRGNPLSGQYSLEAGLDALLAGTGTHYHIQTQQGRVLVRFVRAAPAPDGSTLSLDAIRVQGAASRPSDEVYRTAGSANVITRQEIERFRGTSVGDIFQGTPGVLVGENRNSGGLDVNIRGMQGQSRVPVLVDGARQETTVYRGYAGVSSRTYVDPDLIAGIDISKGPVMTADGTGAVGGVVSMRTLSANDVIPLGKDQGVRLRGSLMGNSSAPPRPGTVAGMNGTGRTYRVDCAVASLCQGEYALPDSFGTSEGMDRPGMLDLRSWAGSIAIAKRFESFDILAAYAQRSQGNYYAGRHGPVPEVELIEKPLPFYTEVTAVRNGIARFRAEERIVNSNNESNTLLLKSNLFLPAGQSWELGYQRYDSEYGELMPSQLIWLDQIKQTTDSTVTAHTYTSRYQWEPLGMDWVKLRFNLWHTHTNSVNRSYSEDLQGTYGGDPSPERYDRYGGDLSNETRLYRWGEHTLSYGLTLQREEIDTDVPLDDQGAPISNAGYGRIGDRDELGLFFNWHWQPVPSVTLDAGLRYTRAETDDHKLIVPKGREECLEYNDDGQCAETVYVESVFCVDHDGDGACDPIRYRTRNSDSAPVVSLAWEPWLNGVQFYARYAEAFRMPSLFETTQGWSVEPALDVPLQPEHAINRELGINLLQQDVLLRGDRLAAKLARFQNLTRDYLTRTSPNAWEEGGQIFVMRNIDSVEVHGTELSLEYDMGTVYGEISGTYYHHIEVCHYGSYRRERCNDYGVANSYFNNMIPPRWHASATLGTRLFQRRLDIGARGTFMGQRTPTPPFNDDTARGFNQPVPWHEYKLLDLYATWRHSDTLSVDVNLDNVTDQYYLDALSLGMVPAPGRTARVSLTLNF
ncbi:HasR protein [Alcanivorax sp. S71-1-4]|uniref:TonB-dependent receptor n=1 Tax=Alcanivorax sp. S71-1-4 TaxID=1177159 RepID=UPI0016960396|nr:TonB-dependent receptor [Alcanivorax sp. S71-1-4]KAF0808242.1 HasR protein [Alcanivorax sp. S71-1-4]